MYVLVSERMEWEDIVIVKDKNVAIQMSKEYPDCRVEIFEENGDGRYRPTYRIVNILLDNSV
jgi:hypothetical protein